MCPLEKLIPGICLGPLSGLLKHLKPFEKHFHTQEILNHHKMYLLCHKKYSGNIYLKNPAISGNTFLRVVAQLDPSPGNVGSSSVPVVVLLTGRVTHGYVKGKPSISLRRTTMCWLTGCLSFSFRGIYLNKKVTRICFISK